MTPAPKERIHVWYNKPGQKPTAEKVIDPKLELRVVWLNGHVAKYLFIYVYAHRFVRFSTLVRETFYSRQQLMQRFLTSQGAESGCEGSALNGAAITTTTPRHHQQRLRGRREGCDGKDTIAGGWRGHDTGNASTNSQQLWLPTQNLHKPAKLEVVINTLVNGPTPMCI